MEALTGEQIEQRLNNSEFAMLQLRDLEVLRHELDEHIWKMRKIVQAEIRMHKDGYKKIYDEDIVGKRKEVLNIPVTTLIKFQEAIEELRQKIFYMDEKKREYQELLKQYGMLHNVYF